MNSRRYLLCVAGCAFCIATYPIQIGYIVGIPLPVVGFEKVGSGHVPFFSCLSPIFAVVDFMMPFGMYRILCFLFSRKSNASQSGGDITEC